jgi:regulator of protease activity HflC (stomatin/prohibitin superfamily)
MMKRIATIVCATALLATTTGCLRSTGGTEVGIKFNVVTGGAAVVDPGESKFVVPIVHRWFVYDKKLQKMEMKKAPKHNDALDFKTRDGNDIEVDLTIQWKIEQDKAPDLLRKVAPTMEDIARGIVRPLARSVPRDVLNELSSEEFYDASKRAQKEALAHQRLDKALREFGIICERVILGNYRFHAKYQKAIDDKKVAAQEANKFASAAEAERRAWERNLEQTRGAVRQQIAAERGLFEHAKLSADAYYEARKFEADAILSARKAQAKGIREQRAAMSGTGGRTMVKLKVAEALKGKKIVLIPMGEGGGLSLQKTDVNQLLETLGVDSIATSAAPIGGTAPSKN